MKIGEFVKLYLGRIFDYCEKHDHAELAHLLDPDYSKKTFDINFPFCREVAEIRAVDSKRYWTSVYVVQGKSVRVTSQWYNSHIGKSRALFRQYLLAKGLATKEELTAADGPDSESQERKSGVETCGPKQRRSNARYRGNAIGNAQNYLVRNILSNLGEESFSDKDWESTKAYFGHRCAYCGSDGDLVIEHAIPINRQSLGEHRLGNLVPSCRSCNSEKGERDFRDFLSESPERLKKIEQYMDERNYVPLGDNEQVRIILDTAYQEVSQVAERYLRILNSIFPRAD